MPEGGNGCQSGMFLVFVARSQTCSVDVDGRSFDGSSSSDPSSSDVRRSCQQATTIYNTHGLYTITAYNTESKKHATLRLGITLANVDQFS